MKAKGAVFLDRDGTLIVEKHYLHRPEEVAFFPGAVEALRRLVKAGLPLFLVTNQSGVGRGYFTIEDVERVHAHIRDELARHGVHFEAVYVAPEAPDEPSRGRKPSPQFLFDARDQFGISLEESFMIGDKWIDLECGWNARVRQCVLVRTGYGAGLERERISDLNRAVIVDGLPEAADWILRQISSSLPNR